MSYCYSGFGAIDYQKAVISQVPFENLGLVPWDRLTIDLIHTSQTDPSVSKSLSVFGGLASTSASLALSIASGTSSPLSLLSAAPDIVAKAMAVLSTVYPEAAASIVGAMGDVAGEAASSVAASIPILQIGVAVLKSVSAGIAEDADEYNRKQKQACIDRQKPCNASRGSMYGGRVPADILCGPIGYAFETMFEFASPIVGSKIHLPCPDGISSIGQKPCTGEIQSSVSVPGVDYRLRDVSFYPGVQFVPSPTVTAIRKARLAIQGSRGNGSSDGGQAIWPIYLDLVTDLFRTGATDWSHAKNVLCASPAYTLGLVKSGEAAPEHVTNGCCTVSTSAFQQVKALVDDWQLNRDPTYAGDRVKSEAFFADLQKAKAKLLSPNKSLPSAASVAKNLLGVSAGSGISSSKPKTTVPSATSLVSLMPKSTHVVQSSMVSSNRATSSKSLVQATAGGGMSPLLIFGGLVLLGGGGYYAYTQYEKRKRS